MWRYHGRLERDLARWRAAGWVTDEGEAGIRAEIAAERPLFGLSGALAVLGAVLIGFAAMSFVAANWQEMSKLARLVLLGGGLAAAYAAAGALLERGMAGFGHAALLAGVALFGASIMLIAQMYHMDGNPPDAVWLWTVGALATGALVGSNPALGAAMLLAGLWSGWETAQTAAVHWSFLTLWAAIAAAMALRGWSGGLVLAGLALSVWIVALGYLLDGGHAHPIVVALGLGITGLGALLARSEHGPPLRLAPATVIGFGMAITFAGLFAMQFVEITPVARLVLLALVTLAGLLAAIYWGALTGRRGVLWLGYGMFSIEVLGIYFKTIGTLMGSSVFFLVTGVIVLALAAMAWRLHERTATLGGAL